MRTAGAAGTLKLLLSAAGAAKGTAAVGTVLLVAAGSALQVAASTVLLGLVVHCWWLMVRCWWRLIVRC
jgi:hypothetical protein